MIARLVAVSMLLGTFAFGTLAFADPGDGYYKHRYRPYKYYKPHKAYKKWRKAEWKAWKRWRKGGRGPVYVYPAPGPVYVAPPPPVVVLP